MVINLTKSYKECPLCGNTDNFALINKIANPSSDPILTCLSCGYEQSQSEQFQYQIDFTAATGNGTLVATARWGSVATGDKYPLRTSISFSISGITSHYQVTVWTITNNDSGGSIVLADDGNNALTITLLYNATVVPTLAAQKILTVGALTHGTMALNPTYSIVDAKWEGGTPITAGTYYYDVNVTIILLPIPATGYHFTQWNDAGTDNPRVHKMTASVTETPTFASN